MHTPSGQCCVHLYARILSTSSTSVSIFSAWCYSSVSISMDATFLTDVREACLQLNRKFSVSQPPTCTTHDPTQFFFLRFGSLMPLFLIYLYFYRLKSQSLRPTPNMYSSSVNGINIREAYLTFSFCL